MNISCCICDKKFYIKPSHFEKRIHKDKLSCSLACAAIVKKELMSGENNHQYGLKGDLNSSYISDIRTSSNGYILVKALNHPLCHYDGYMLLHRLLYEEYLKQSGDYQFLIDMDGYWVLNPAYVIHHIDGNRTNNKIENLELTTLSEHSARHSEEKTIIRDFLGRIKTVVGEIKSGELARNKRFDAGQDVKASKSTIIPAKGDAIVFTNLYLNVPEGYVGLLWSRSGLSVKHKIEVGAGCIDSGYNGEILVHLYNHSDVAYEVKAGDKIAQLLTIPIDLNEYVSVQEFSFESERGTAGFNSSGY
jgi:dUTP pyrophosphatase